MTERDWDAIVLGAGGAGLMAAATAGQAGARVLVLDHAEKPGKKILISGGGRCNFTNTGTEPENFLSENPHFAKSALSRYTQWDFLALVERHGIAWHEKTLGQLFCDGSARQIVAMLIEECRKGGVEVRLSTPIGEIGHADGRFRVAGASARALVIATGGPSIPKMGATGIAYDIARRFGLGIVTPRPALVPFTLGEGDADLKAIPGVAFPAVARVGSVSFEEAALFTHRGLSGPAILQVSSYWAPGEPVSLCVLPEAGAVLRAAPARDAARVPQGIALPAPTHAPRGCACRTHRPVAGARQLLRRRPRCSGGGADGADLPADGHRGLRQGRGYGGRHFHSRAVVEDDGGARPPRPLRHRRGGRRDRLARRLQLPVGLVLGRRGGSRNRGTGAEPLRVWTAS
jgi:hypothetical protein